MKKMVLCISLIVLHSVHLLCMSQARPQVITDDSDEAGGQDVSVSVSESPGGQAADGASITSEEGQVDSAEVDSLVASHGRQSMCEKEMLARVVLSMAKEPNAWLGTFFKCLEKHGVSIHKAQDGTNHPLLQAAAAGNVDVIRALFDDQEQSFSLSEGAREMARQKSCAGESVFHLAAARGHVSVLQYLYDRLGPDIFDELCLPNEELHARNTDRDGNNVLHLAAKNGHVNVIKFFANKWLRKSDFKKLVRQPRGNGRTPVHVAAQKGATEMINIFKDIIEEDSDSKPFKDLVMQRDSSGFTAVINAVRGGHVPMIDCLSAVLGEKELFSHLLENSDLQHYNSVHNAAIRGSHAVLERIHAALGAKDFAKLACTMCQGYNALSLALQHGSEGEGLNACLSQLREALGQEQFLSLASSTNYQGLNAPMIAVCNGHFNTAQKLRELLGADNFNELLHKQIISVDTGNEVDRGNVLHDLVQKGKTEVFTRLFEDSKEDSSSADKLFESAALDVLLLQQDGDGCTCLHLAATKGYVQVFESLFASDISSDQRLQIMLKLDNQGESILYKAIKKNQHAVLRKIAENFDRQALTELIHPGQQIIDQNSQLFSDLPEWLLHGVKAKDGACWKTICMLAELMGAARFQHFVPQPDGFGRTLVHEAAKQGRVEFFEKLKAGCVDGADMDALDKLLLSYNLNRPYTILHEAVQNNQHCICSWIFEQHQAVFAMLKDVKTSTSHATPLIMASDLGHRSLADELRQMCEQLNPGSLLVKAVLENDQEGVFRICNTYHSELSLEEIARAIEKAEELAATELDEGGKTRSEDIRYKLRQTRKKVQNG